MATTTQKTGYENHQHVLPHEKGWAVKTSSAERPSRIFDTKSDAIKEATAMARKKGTVLVVHAKDGTIQEHRNFGN